MGAGKYTVAIDLGTSGLKAALVSTRGEILARSFQPLEVLVDGARAEQDPEAWWRALVRCTRELVAEERVPRASIRAICCTGQWSGTVPVDRDGRALMNAITWMDCRGAPHVRRVVGGFPEIDGYAAHKVFQWIRVTGGAPGLSGKDSLGHVLYLKNERPDVYERTHKFLEPIDYLSGRLCGRLASAVSTITLHWVTDNRDINKIDYDPGLLRRTGLARDKLPDLVPATSVLGPLTAAAAEELGLSRDVVVVAGAGDTHSGAIGSGAVQDYQAHVSLGTSSWLICHLPTRKMSLLHKLASIPSAIPGRYLLINEQESAAVCLAHLKDHLLLDQDELGTRASAADPYEAFNRLAARVPAGSGGVIFTPWLNGERSPVDDHTLRSSFFNQSLETRRGHLVRAVMEGVAYNSRWLLQYVEQLLRRPLDAVHLIGGGARSNVWCQVYADVLDRPVRQMQEPTHANARGAGLMGAVALGELRYEDVPAVVPVARTFQPQSAHRQRYTALFKEFVNLYRATHAISRRIHDLQLPQSTSPAAEDSVRPVPVSEEG